MMLSIIVPHFNSPALLQRLLDSIPNQENVEVLVIDDLSNSHLKEYYECKDRNSDRNVIFLNNTVQNKGAGGAEMLDWLMQRENGFCLLTLMIIL